MVVAPTTAAAAATGAQYSTLLHAFECKGIYVGDGYIDVYSFL